MAWCITCYYYHLKLFRSVHNSILFPCRFNDGDILIWFAYMYGMYIIHAGVVYIGHLLILFVLGPLRSLAFSVSISACYIVILLHHYGFTMLWIDKWFWSHFHRAVNFNIELWATGAMVLWGNQKPFDMFSYSAWFVSWHIRPGLQTANALPYMVDMR